VLADPRLGMIFSLRKHYQKSALGLRLHAEAAHD
jgi:hypothetical protein